MKLSRLKKLKDRRNYQSTIAKINKYLEQTANTPLPYIPKETHKPSEFGNKCLRRIYYSYFRVEPDRKLKANTLRIFQTGRALESMLIEWLKAIGEYVPYKEPSGKEQSSDTPKEEFPIYSEKWRVRKGFIDNVAITENKLWIHEIKTIKADKFNTLVEPLDEHLIQVAVYVKAFEEALARGDYSHIEELHGQSEVHGVKFFYINKDNSEINEFIISRETIEDHIARVDAKAAIINPYCDKKELPPKTQGACFFCPFWKKCENEWNEVKTYNEKLEESIL